MGVLSLTLLLLAGAQDDPAKRTRELVERLDGDRVEDRDQAERELPSLGKPAIQEIRRVQPAARGEYAERLRRVLRRLVLADPWEEKLLDTMDEKDDGRQVEFSPAGHAAYESGLNPSRHVILDGTAGKDFEGIDHLDWSPDGKSLSYVASARGKSYVLVGDRTLGPFDSMGSIALFPRNPIVFSPDSKRVAFRAFSEARQFVVVDGVPQDLFDDVDHPVFSPDGTHLAYAANRGGRHTNRVTVVTGGKWFIVVDGKKGEEFDKVSLLSDTGIAQQSPVFSPDSKRMAYCAREGTKYFVVEGGRRGEEFEFLFAVGFSSDSLHLDYVVSEKDRLVGYRDGKPSGPLLGFALPEASSPDGARRAHTEGDAPRKKEWMVVDGQKGEEFDRACFPCFSPDGKHVAYMAGNGEEYFIVVDGKRGPPFEGVGWPVFDALGREVIYTASQGKKMFVVAGSRNGEGFDEILIREGSSLIPPPLQTIPGSTAVVYRARIGGTYDAQSRRYQGAEWYVVVGDRKIGPFDRVWQPQVSPDGRQVAFGARKGRELWWKVVPVP